MLTWMDSLKGRSMMRLASFTDEEMLNLIDLAAQLKARRAAGVRGDFFSKLLLTSHSLQAALQLLFRSRLNV